jgi:hypothetical protein
VTAIAEKQSVVLKEARGKYAAVVITPNFSEIYRFINVGMQGIFHTKYAGTYPDCPPTELSIPSSTLYYWQ